ncbi:hypothetical protein ACFL3S_03205 [Gemmatimonadota bacterium]
MSLRTALWVAGIFLGLFVLDRLLLWMESRGWIFYRRIKGGRGAATYHLLEWTSVLDPTMRQVQVESVKEERQEDEAGDPPGEDEGGSENPPIRSGDPSDPTSPGP